MNTTKSTLSNSIILNGLFLFLLNVTLIALIGYLTLEVEANQNSRIGAFFLSFFIPIFLVILTKKLSALERILKYGFGFISLIIITLFFFGLSEGIKTGTLPCLMFALLVLYFGEHLIPVKKN